MVSTLKSELSVTRRSNILVNHMKYGRIEILVIIKLSDIDHSLACGSTQVGLFYMMLERVK